MLPLDPIMTMVSARSSYRALQWGTMNSVGFQAQTGLMDYGILNTLQVDPYGNINSTALGDYDGEHRRFGGPGGPTPSPPWCWKTTLWPTSQKARSVRRVAFTPSPASPAGRARPSGEQGFR